MTQFPKICPWQVAHDYGHTPAQQPLTPSANSSFPCAQLIRWKFQKLPYLVEWLHELTLSVSYPEVTKSYTNSDSFFFFVHNLKYPKPLWSGLDFDINMSY